MLALPSSRVDSSTHSILTCESVRVELASQSSPGKSPRKVPRAWSYCRLSLLSLTWSVTVIYRSMLREHILMGQCDIIGSINIFRVTRSTRRNSFDRVGFEFWLYSTLLDSTATLPHTSTVLVWGDCCSNTKLSGRSSTQLLFRKSLRNAFFFSFRWGEWQ